LAAWCITIEEDAKYWLHLALGNKEYETCWTEFFRDNGESRGLRTPTSMTDLRDGAPGLVNAIEGIFSSSIRVRCWSKIGHLEDMLPLNFEVHSQSATASRKKWLRN
jgi:hypothetical protein